MQGKGKGGGKQDFRRWDPYQSQKGKGKDGKGYKGGKGPLFNMSNEESWEEPYAQQGYYDLHGYPMPDQMLLIDG